MTISRRKNTKNYLNIALFWIRHHQFDKYSRGTDVCNIFVGKNLLCNLHLENLLSSSSQADLFIASKVSPAAVLDPTGSGSTTASTFATNAMDAHQQENVQVREKSFYFSHYR